MRKITSILLCIIFLFSFTLTALAAPSQSTKIKTIIPSNYKVTISIGDNGDVLIANHDFINSGFVLTLDRHVEQEYIFRGKSGYEIDKILYNGKDITPELEAGRWVAPKLITDSSLSASYKLSQEKSSNIRYVVVGEVTINDKPLTNTKLELHSSVKTSVTDKDGKFRFDDVEEGIHTLTAMNGNSIIGFVEFSIYKADTDGLVMNKLPDGSFEVLIGKDFPAIRFDFDLDKNGKMNLKTADPIKNLQDLKSFPNYREDTSVIESALIFITIFFIIFLFIFFLIKRRKQESQSI